MRWLAGLSALVLVVLAVWSVAIGPGNVWRLLTHGPTTVWDHLEYPGRELSPSPRPMPWPVAARSLHPQR